MALKTFTFNGINSSTVGLYLLESSTYNSAQRIIDTYKIPGRNGSLMYDTESYEDIVITYKIALRTDTNNAQPLREQVQKIKEFLYQKDVINSNYEFKILKDDYNPSIYRYAYFAGPIDWETMLNRYGSAEISFICKPFVCYVYSSSSDTYKVEITLNANTSRTVNLPTLNKVLVRSPINFRITPVTSGSRPTSGQIRISGLNNTEGYLTIKAGDYPSDIPFGILIDSDEHEILYKSTGINTEIRSLYNLLVLSSAAARFIKFPELFCNNGAGTSNIYITNDTDIQIKVEIECELRGV